MLPFGRRILLIDHDVAFRRYASHLLAGMGFEIVDVSTGRAGLLEVNRATPECIIVDLDLPDMSGLEVIRAISADAPPRPPIVLVASELGLETAVHAMKDGAKDVAKKPIDPERFRTLVTGAIGRSDLAKDIARIETLAPRGLSSETLVAESTPMRAALERAERLANVDMPVLLVGERGAGKTVIARHLHSVSARALKPFVFVHATGDGPGAAEQALFGSNGRSSAFAQAQDGAVFIESIVALGPSGQDRLARVLSELAAARAGGQAVSYPRVIVGSTRELAAELEAGRLREELARRLSPLVIHVPPLRDRKKDLPELIRRIVARICREEGRAPVAIGEDVVRRFLDHSWPGNLPELEASVIRAVLLARDGTVRLEDLTSGGSPRIEPSADGQGRGWAPALGDNGAVLTFDEYEAEIFRFALKQAGGCVSRAAEMLGVGRATMYRKMRSYDIDAPPVAERDIVRTGRRPRRADEPVQPMAAAASRDSLPPLN